MPFYREIRIVFVGNMCLPFVYNCISSKSKLCLSPKYSFRMGSPFDDLGGTFWPWENRKFWGGNPSRNHQENGITILGSHKNYHITNSPSDQFCKRFHPPNKQVNNLWKVQIFSLCSTWWFLLDSSHLKHILVVVRGIFPKF